MNTPHHFETRPDERNRLLFFMAVGLSVVAVLGNLLLLGGFVYPRWRRLQEVNGALSQARRQLRSVQQEQANWTSEMVRADIEATEAQLSELASAFISEDEVAAIVDRFYRYAEEAEINILGMQSTSTPELEEDLEPFTVRIFNVEAEAEIANLLEFLGRIEESAYVGFDVTNVILMADAAGATLTFDAVLYTSPYATGAQSPTAGDSTEALLEQAWQAERWQQAIDLLDQLLQDDPSNGTWLERLYRARVNYGNELLEDGRAAAARTQFELALQIDPMGSAAAAGLEQAEALFKPTPAPVIILEEQLDAAWQTEEWETAIALLQQLRNLEPAELSWEEKLYAAEVNYGYQLMEEGAYQEAKEAFSRALDLNPGGAEAQEGLRLLSGEATPVPPTPRPTATQPVVTTYTVQQGDTLYSISRQFGVTLESLLAVNNLSSYDISVGQRLRIPTQ